MDYVYRRVTDFNAPMWPHLGKFVDIDGKKELELVRLRAVWYGQKFPNDYYPSDPPDATDVFSYYAHWMAINPAHVLDKGILKKNTPSEYLLDLPESGDVWNYSLYSRRIKDAIEVLEPGVHQFFPFRLYMPDESSYKEYFVIHRANQSIDCVAYEKSGYTSSINSLGASYWASPSPREKHELYLYANKISGLHLFGSSPVRDYFYSSELVSMLDGKLFPSGHALEKVKLI